MRSILASTDQRNRTLRSSAHEEDAPNLRDIHVRSSTRTKGIIMSRQSTPEIKVPNRSEPSVDREAVEAMAFQIWLERGCPIGSDQEDWYQAEAALKDRHQSNQRAA